MNKFLLPLAVAGLSLLAMGRSQAVGFYRYTTAVINQPGGFVAGQGLFEDLGFTTAASTAPDPTVGPAYGLGSIVYTTKAGNTVALIPGDNQLSPSAGNTNFGPTQLTPVNLRVISEQSPNQTWSQKIRIHINIFDVPTDTDIIVDGTPVGTFIYDGTLNIAALGPGVAVSSFTPGGFVGPSTQVIGSTTYSLRFVNYTPFQQFGATNDGAIAFEIVGTGDVPEPGAVALGVGMLVGAGALLRRRRK
jgi:LPXTG-motif cell wall-anchored protein